MGQALSFVTSAPCERARERVRARMAHDQARDQARAAPAAATPPAATPPAAIIKPAPQRPRLSAAAAAQAAPEKDYVHL